MMEQSRHKDYPGLDCFRLLAVLLIIANHTSPLTLFSDTGDFILTRVIARVAVPFFFMTSGYFVISRYTDNAKRLGVFVKKTAIIYAAATCLYIPVNIYNHYFCMDNLLPNMIKDIVFDGTFYHLWYLPASVLGAAIAWYLVKKLDYMGGLAVAFILYLAGMFGDSYYGIVKGIPSFNGFYNLIFQVADYTRNGIFYAPIFFLLGGLIADNPHRIAIRKSILGFGISMALMAGEALILHRLHLQRHDSMYQFLLPCMYFLFHILLHWKGKRPRQLRMVSLMIYIIHPMVIILVRLLAKLWHCEGLLVENSILHYLAVCLASIIFGMAAAALWNKNKPEKVDAQRARAYIEIDLAHLGHNVGVLKEAMPEKCRLMAVVKANAYGHGAFEVAAHLNKMGVGAFAVATIDEGIRLRKYGIRGEILILGYTNVYLASELKKYNLTQTLIDYAYARALNSQNVTVKVHIKIDTGMHRLGISSEALSEVKEVFGMKKLKICGMFTHLCCSDSLKMEDVAFTREQIHNFYRLVDGLKASGIAIPKLHIQSSYGLFNYPGLNCDYVRAGIALYGVLSSPDSGTEQKLDLRPVLSLKSRIVLIRSVGEGSSIGYGRSFVTKRDSRIAIVPIGYGDGFPRNLSCGKASVSVHQKQVPVIGRICMDQLAIDITDVDNVAVGDTVTLIGNAGEEGVSAPFVAEHSGSISNELLCRMGARLPVIAK